MNPAEFKIFCDLITSLERSRQMICTVPDRFEMQARARFVDEAKTLLTKARDLRQSSKPL